MIIPYQRLSSLLIMFLGLVIWGGCASQELNQAIDQYQAAESKVKLGDSQEEVLAILQPTQASLRGQFKRAPEHWIDPKSGKAVDLYYFRSVYVYYPQHGQTRDKLFTPYLFIDNTLVAIGWNALRSLAIQPQSSSQNSQRNPNPEIQQSQVGSESGLLTNPSGETFLAPITPNAYGPGVNSDATGRPFTYEPEFGGSGHPDPTLKVTPNAYGPGVSMDQYGRPVRPKSWP